MQAKRKAQQIDRVCVMPSELSPTWPLAIAAIDAVGEGILQFLRETPTPGLQIFPPSSLAQYHTLFPPATIDSAINY